MGANSKNIILLPLLFALVLLISSEVLAVKDVPKKKVSEEKVTVSHSSKGFEIEVEAGKNEIELELNKDRSAEVEVEVRGHEVEVEIGKNGSLQVEIDGKKIKA